MLHTSQEIADIAKRALQDQESLRNKALRALIYARQHFTPQRQIGRLLQLVEQHRAGLRGYDVRTLSRDFVCRTHIVFVLLHSIRFPSRWPAGSMPMALCLDGATESDEYHSDRDIP